MKQVLRFNKVIKLIIIAGDLCILNTIFIVLYHIIDVQTLGETFANSLSRLLVLLNLVYITCNYSKGIILHERIVRPERIVTRAIRNTFFHAVVFISLISLADFGTLSARFFVLFYFFFLICLTIYRLTFRQILKSYRRSGGNSRSTILLGDGENMIELYHEMTGNAASGFKIIGYFAEAPSPLYPEQCPYLGLPQHALPYIQHSPTEHVYCGLPSSYSKEILPIINYCDIRQEPLAQPENRLLKRMFDILFSLLFLCTLFPVIYLIIGTAIKITSPGPIFFKQKRSGEAGKEFLCYKFRSMRVNKDSDTMQATKNDPRKTKLGNFLRKSNIDELPQFINVLLGSMSVVGPRPHMLKHTEEYSKLVDKYMVRHLIKPGITGWAQINGFRGETKELWQMEGRVERDIWYLEHWTFMLDLYIIYKTVKNAIQGEKAAY